MKQFQKVIRDLAIGGLEPTELTAHFDYLIDTFDNLTTQNSELSQRVSEYEKRVEETEGELEKIREKYHEEFLKSGDGEETPDTDSNKILSEEDVLEELKRLSNKEGE